MAPIKRGQISLYFHFNKIGKESGTSFQSSTFSQKHVRNVCHTAHQHLPNFVLTVLWVQRNKHKSNFHYAAVSMMTSQILKSVDFSKTQKSRYLEN